MKMPFKPTGEYRKSLCEAPAPLATAASTPSFRITKKNQRLKPISEETRKVSPMIEG